MQEVVVEVSRCDTGGYEARALGLSVFTCAATLEELETGIRDALHCHFEDADCPRTARLRMDKDEVITL
jgi:hypothetical protein